MTHLQHHLTDWVRANRDLVDTLFDESSIPSLSQTDGFSATSWVYASSSQDTIYGDNEPESRDSQTSSSDLTPRSIQKGTQSKNAEDDLRSMMVHHPLHTALRLHKPSQEIQDLVESNPLYLQVPDLDGRLPLHLTVIHNASLETVLLLVDQYPQAVTVQDLNGRIPLGYSDGASAEIVGLLLGW